MPKAKKHILIIEDELKIAQVQSLYLRKAGFDTTIKTDGSQGIEAFYSLQPDLVILDLSLPSMSGVDICKKIRQESQAPIIMVTARGSIEDELLGLGFGADDYVKKPFDPKILIARVEARLRSSDQTLVFGKLVINPEKLTVSVEEAEATLTSRQFDVLCVLANEPGRIFSREAIIDLMPNNEHDVYDRTIDVHIRNIRSAITKISNPSYARQLIKTVNRKGYSFEKNN